MYILFLVLFSILVHRVWFFSNGILSSGDWGFLYEETMRAMGTTPSAWSSIALGSINLQMPTYAMDVLWSFIGKLCGFSCAERIMYLVPSLLFALLSSYILAKKVTGSSLGAFVGSLCFTYNTYFVIGRTGHLPLMLAFAIAPLAFLFLLRIFEKVTLRDLIIFWFVNVVISYVEFRAWYIVVLSEILAITFFSFLDTRKEKVQNITRAFYLFTAIFFVIIMNLYWMIPLSIGNSLTTNQYFARGLFGDSFLNIANAMTLFHPFWTGRGSSLFIVQPITFYFWLIPLAAFGGLFVNRKNKIVVFFASIALIGIFLTKQSDIPFTHIYKFLYDHMPGFSAFREGSKFFFYVALGYSVLIASLIQYVFRSAQEFSHLYRARYIITGIIAAIFIVNVGPIVSGEIGTLFTPRNLPQSYIELKTFLQKDKDFYRTLWVPRESRWTYYDNSHPSFSLAFNLPDEYLMNSRTGILDFLLQENFDSYLDVTSTKYVIVPLIDRANDDDFFVYYQNREIYIKALDSLPFLKKVPTDFTDVTLYENSDYRPHIYSDGVTSEVSYTFVKPYEYKVAIKSLSSPIIIIFSEQFHSEWYMNIETLNIKSADYQSLNNLHFNSFYLDPADLVKNLNKDQYSENADGSLNIEATIYFKPQAYVYVALKIMAVALTLLVIILVTKKVLKK